MFAFTKDSMTVSELIATSIKFGTSTSVQIQGGVSMSVLCEIIASTDNAFEFRMPMTGAGISYIKLTKEGAAEPFTYKYYTKDSKAAQYLETNSHVIVKKTS